MVTRPLSQRRTAGSPTGCIVPFALVFLLAGAAGSYFLLVRPFSRLLASQLWTETQCTVLSSQVAEVSSSDGSTYKIDIRYQYIAGGNLRESNRYDFRIGSSSGAAGKQAIVDRYPPGERVTCWVDPGDPSQAVLSRGFAPAYLFGLIPLVFFAIGAALLVWTVRSGRGVAVPAGVAGVSPFGVPLPIDAAAPVQLRPAVTPLGAFFGLTLLALFWNGIVSVFLWHVASSWRQGQPDGCLTAFLIPFVLVGLGLIYAVGRQFLVLFNPRAHIILTPGVLAPGGTAYLQWKLGSGGRGVRRVKIVLEGREEARYRRGTDTHTDRETFLSLPVVDTEQPFEIEGGGSATFAVPADTVPSFRADNNRIVWSLKVHCDLPNWPDTDDEYEVMVSPGGGA
ncbi:MAG TPA: DUF3592 domain-containing protein [Thermoanaerobaculia bacterium]|jgi:hypothetical protein|nr:DUF3592 domain-containing protein [Thermoanaerobaculia bacterium]